MWNIEFVRTWENSADGGVVTYSRGPTVVRIAANAQIGPGVNFFSGVFVDRGVTVGRGCSIGQCVWIGRGAWIGPEVDLAPGVNIAPGARIDSGERYLSIGPIGERGFLLTIARQSTGKMMFHVGNGHYEKNAFRKVVQGMYMDEKCKHDYLAAVDFAERLF